MKKTPLQHVGESIRKIREYRELTLSDLAELSKIDKGDISKIENGERNPTVNTLIRIAAALNCVLDINFTPR